MKPKGYYKNALDPQKAIPVEVQQHTKKLITILDHDLGGGANLYSEDLIKGLSERGFLTLHIRYSFRLKRFRFSYLGNIHHKEFTLESVSVDRIKALLKSLKVDYIFVNELVSWQNPTEFTKMITELSIPYIVFIHDYFYICPSWHLINDEGRCCNIPDDLKRCKLCLLNNKFSDYPIYYRGQPFDIISWRRKMQSFLKNSYKIVCFSESSKNYLQNVYNDIPITVAEHPLNDMESSVWKRRESKDKTSLTIGVIGDIGFHKGSEILKNLIEHPEYKKLPVNIVITGTVRGFSAEYKSNNKKLVITGPYKREELPELLEKNNVSAVLIPSICPETFSFTTSEAMLLGYPVICFNIGAQAERVKKYNSGIVANDISAEGLLNIFKEILEKSSLIKELSVNTRRYIPPSSEDHLEKILSMLGIGVSSESGILKNNSQHCITPHED